MKISNHLPHLNETSLLVSAGKLESTFFLVKEGEVNQIHNFKINKPEYTDNESRKERRGDAGSMFGGGSTFKHQDDELERLSIKTLTEAITKIADEHKIAGIYLFCPTYLANQIEKGLSRDIKVKIEYIFYGNYNNQHPFVLLSKVQEYLKQEKEIHMTGPIKKEALGILKNTEKFSGKLNRAY